MAAAGWFGSNWQNTWHWLSADDGDRLATNAKIVLEEKTEF